MYPTVEREARHAGLYVAWKHGVTHATLESCQGQIPAYLTTQDTRKRTFDSATNSEVPVMVARHFREAGLMVPRTDDELSTACQAIISNDNRPQNYQNRLGKERECYCR